MMVGRRGPGISPGIHACPALRVLKTWMAGLIPGSSPGTAMTERGRGEGVRVQGEALTSPLTTASAHIGEGLLSPGCCAATLSHTGEGEDARAGHEGFEAMAVELR